MHADPFPENRFITNQHNVLNIKTTKLAGSQLFNLKLTLLILLTLLLLGSSGCNGTTRDNITSDAGFGLVNRESLTNVNLPLGGAVLGTFSLTNAYPNLDFRNALLVTPVPGENRIFVTQQSGQILVFIDNTTSSESTAILDISDRILFGGEQGLLGVALDPDFVDNRFVYLHYSMGSPRRSVISRMTWSTTSDLIEPASEQILLEVEQPYSNHNGGMIAFGLDKHLYIGLGDGGSGGDPQNHGQNTSTLLGNILRIDVHPEDTSLPYAIPSDNPFTNDSDFRPEIYAYGLRNPFRFSFDRQTGDLWAGDVGQNAREEIDIIQPGGNYGWRVLEGTLDYDDSLNSLPVGSFLPPIIEYDHSQGVSVIGGYVYRGTRLPSLIGKYLYTDFGSGTIWALTYNDGQVIANNVIATTQNPTSFGETADGDVLIVTRNSGIFKLESTIVGGQIPTNLSETGLFASLLDLTSASGMIEYAPKQSFWSDGAYKRRWIGIPDGRKINFSSHDWELPVGSIAVKHFEIELTQNDPDSAKRLETRVLINTDQGWQGFTYRWNEAGTDATLLMEQESEVLTVSLADGSTREQLYDYPSRTDCLQCHTPVAGYTLGLTTPQMNTTFDYPLQTDNQLRSLNNIGLFAHDPSINPGESEQFTVISQLDEESQSVEVRARDYLDVNCSHCHQPDGPANSTLDLRASTPVNDMNALGVMALAGDLGIDGSMIIAQGSKDQSILWQRIQRLDETRMPPLSSHVVDRQAVEIVGQWIEAL